MASQGLQHIHVAGNGWVHRDISPGNILIASPDEPALLVDFEYAKELNDNSSHEVRTVRFGFI